MKFGRHSQSMPIAFGLNAKNLLICLRHSFESFTIIVVDSVLITATIGDNLTVIANITADETECNPNDNQAIYCF